MGRGGGLKVISPLDGGGQEVLLTLIQGGCNFILRPTLLILEPPPPLQIIIAQSLSLALNIEGAIDISFFQVNCETLDIYFAEVSNVIDCASQLRIRDF